MSDKFFINSQQENDDFEKATVATVVTGATAAMDGKIAIFLTCEAVSVTSKGGCDGRATPSPTCR